MDKGGEGTRLIREFTNDKKIQQLQSIIVIEIIIRWVPRLCCERQQRERLHKDDVVFTSDI